MEQAAEYKAWNRMGALVKEVFDFDPQIAVTKWDLEK